MALRTESIRELRLRAFHCVDAAESALTGSVCIAGRWVLSRVLVQLDVEVIWPDGSWQHARNDRSQSCIDAGLDRRVHHLQHCILRMKLNDGN